MNKLNIIKKTLLGLTGFAVAFLFATGVAHATIPYNGDQTVASPVPAFNVFTGVPAPVGNEPDFLRARVPVNGDSSDATTQYVDPLSTNCTNGEVIQMKVYVHNGAGVDGNQNGSGPSVAHGTAVKVTIPGTEATSFNPNATISARNAATVNDDVTINCSNGKKVKLDYIAGSASSFSLGTGVVPLSDAIVTTGVPIRSESVPGDVWGCWNERVYVVLSVKVEEVPPQVLPATCNLINVTQVDRKVALNSVDFTANDAKVNSLIVDFGDGSGAQNHNFSDLPVSHTYNNNGTFTLAVTLVTDQGNVTSQNCSKPFTFATTTTVTTNTPQVQATSLTNTGPGDVAGIFTATTIGGAFLHRKWTLRRSK